MWRIVIQRVKDFNFLPWQRSWGPSFYVFWKLNAASLFISWLLYDFNFGLLIRLILIRCFLIWGVRLPFDCCAIVLILLIFFFGTWVLSHLWGLECNRGGTLLVACLRNLVLLYFVRRPRSFLLFFLLFWFHKNLFYVWLHKQKLNFLWVYCGFFNITDRVIVLYSTLV